MNFDKDPKLVFTFNAFPEVISVSSYRRKLAQVMVCTPNVDIFIFWTTYNVGKVMAKNLKKEKHYFS